MKRVATALVLIPVVVWAILAAPPWLFKSVLALVGLLAFYEYDQITAAQGIAKAGVPAMLLGIALLLAPEPALVVMLAALVAMTLAMRVNDLGRALSTAASFLLGIAYIFGAFRCAVELRGLNPHWLIVAFVVCWVGDTAALYVGRAFGKHKLAPRVSPAKSWEGAASSVVGGTLAGAVYAHFLMPEAVLTVVWVGALANVAGQLGDLCESAFKRGAGVKDSGTTLPGHGGWLDRIDSSLFSIPVVYMALYILSHVS